MNIKNLIGLKLPIVLASESPRRKKLLEQLGFDFEIVPAHIEENNNDGLKPHEHVCRLAELKARAAAGIYKKSAIIIGADTIVVLKGEILSKPKDADDAVRMLKLLSGATHTVYTGVAVLDSTLVAQTPPSVNSASLSFKELSDVQTTEVTFRELDEAEIIAYVGSGSPMDKAGGYGIQDDFGAVFVSNINGCYYNIVGLPLEMLWGMLRKL